MAVSVRVGDGAVDDMLGDFQEKPRRRERQEGEQHETQLEAQRRTYDKAFEAPSRRTLARDGQRARYQSRPSTVRRNGRRAVQLATPQSHPT